MWQPYRAASYSNYGEALKGLYKQGTPYSFYKGNGVRALHIILFHKFNTEMTFKIEQLIPQQWKQLKKIQGAPELLLSCTVDMLLQPLHVAESRLILQNRQTNFSAYRSLIEFMKKTPLQDMFRANLLHLPRNCLVALQGLKLTDQVTYASFYGQVIGSQTLAYPFLLVQRRKECLTNSEQLRGRGFTSLVENGSSSFFAMARKIYAEEGFRGFYRGYTAYMFAICFWAAALPSTSDALLNVYPYL